MNESEMIKFLADNLSIEIGQFEEFGPVEILSVKLELGDTVISESTCTLPSNKSDV